MTSAVGTSSQPLATGGHGTAGPSVAAVAVDEDGNVDAHWGRARRLAVAEVEQGVLTRWDEDDVQWDALHETDSERAHHARVARYLKQQGVTVVVAFHMGHGMRAVLERMGITLRLGASGDARQAVLNALGSQPGGTTPGA